MSRFPTLLPLRYFRAVARTGSITAAAREPTIAQSTLRAALSPVGVLHGLESLTERSTRTGVWSERRSGSRCEALLSDDMFASGPGWADRTTGVPTWVGGLRMKGEWT